MSRPAKQLAYLFLLVGIHVVCFFVLFCLVCSLRLVLLASVPSPAGCNSPNCVCACVLMFAAGILAMAKFSHPVKQLTVRCFISVVLSFIITSYIHTSKCFAFEQGRESCRGKTMLLKVHVLCRTASAGLGI